MRPQDGLEMSAELKAGYGTPAASGEKPADGAVTPGEGRKAVPTTSDRIEFANTLRGVAAMSVIFAHLGNTFWHWPHLVEWLTGIAAVPATPSTLSRLVPSALGSWGVSLFFVISGFVIPYSLERYSVKGFIVGRLWRIWPTCWVGLSITVAAVVIGVHFMGGTVPFTFRDAITHFFPPFAAIADSRQIDSVMWTLEIEMFFYIVCALAAARLRDGHWTLWLYPLGVLVLWFGIDQIVGHAQADYPTLVRRLTYFDLDPPYIAFMFCGVALNLYQRGKLALPATIVAVVFWWGMFALTQAFGHTAVKSSAPLFASGLALFIVCMMAQKWFRRSRITRFFSDISYPIYIIHGVAGYVLLHALTRANWNSDLASMTVICIMVLIAWLVHRFVEAPTHRIGQRIARNLSEPAT